MWQVARRPAELCQHVAPQGGCERQGAVGGAALSSERLLRGYLLLSRRVRRPRRLRSVQLLSKDAPQSCFERLF